MITGYINGFSITFDTFLVNAIFSFQLPGVTDTFERIVRSLRNKLKQKGLTDTLLERVNNENITNNHSSSPLSPHPPPTCGTSCNDNNNRRTIATAEKSEETTSDKDTTLYERGCEHSEPTDT